MVKRTPSLRCGTCYGKLRRGPQPVVWLLCHVIYNLILISKNTTFGESYCLQFYKAVLALKGKANMSKDSRKKKKL